MIGTNEKDSNHSHCPFGLVLPGLGGTWKIEWDNNFT